MLVIAPKSIIIVRVTVPEQDKQDSQPCLSSCGYRTPLISFPCIQIKSFDFVDKPIELMQHSLRQ